MEWRGIVSEKGNINRQIAVDNKLLKEIKAWITRLYNWAKEQAAQPQNSTLDQLYKAQGKANASKTRSCSSRIKALQANAKLLAFLQGNSITSMEEFYEKVSDLRGLAAQLDGSDREKLNRIIVQFSH